MNCRSERKKYSDWIIPEDKQEKLILSIDGSEDLEYRPIRCPKCNRIQFYVAGDCNEGHFKVLCSRCKENLLMSFRYFHSRNRRRRALNEGYLIRR